MVPSAATATGSVVERRDVRRPVTTARLHENHRCLHAGNADGVNARSDGRTDEDEFWRVFVVARRDDDEQKRLVGGGETVGPQRPDISPMYVISEDARVLHRRRVPPERRRNDNLNE